MPFSGRSFRRIVRTSLATAAATQVAAYAASRVLGRRDTVDAAWAPGFAAIALSAAAAGEGDRSRRGLLATGLSVWGLRLGSHVVSRIRHTDSEDPRYTELLEGASPAKQIVRVFLTQGVAQFFVSLPVQVAAASGPPRGVFKAVAGLGAALMAGGIAIEAVADRQLEAYKNTPKDDRPQVLDTGVWGWSRHPNYFGDAALWSGVYLVAASARPGIWTVLSPAAMIWFLVFGTGAKPTEKRMEDRPGFADYQRRVSFFVPLPPKKN